MSHPQPMKATRVLGAALGVASAAFLGVTAFVKWFDLQSAVLVLAIAYGGILALAAAFSGWALLRARTGSQRWQLLAELALFAVCLAGTSVFVWNEIQGSITQ